MKFEFLLVLRRVLANSGVTPSLNACFNTSWACVFPWFFTEPARLHKSDACENHLSGCGEQPGLTAPERWMIPGGCA